MPEYPYLIMDRAQAARIREETKYDEHKLDPQEILEGPHKGKSALSVRIKDDMNYADRHDMLEVLNTAELDPAIAWPDTGEPI